MSTFPPEQHVLLILGEVRGDVKGIARSITDLERKIERVEAASAARVDDLEGKLSAATTRIGKLEEIKTRVALFATALGVSSAIAVPQLSTIIRFILGG